MLVYSAAAACNGKDVTVVFLNNGVQTSVWLLFYPATLVVKLPVPLLRCLCRKITLKIRNHHQKTGANHVCALDALIQKDLIIIYC